MTVWFTACWLFAAQKDGISAQSLQRSLEIGSYPTAWTMLHRLRTVLVRPGRVRLSGTVEVDETYNRRRSGSRGLVFFHLLQLAVAHHPVRYRTLVANPEPKQTPPIPPNHAVTRQAWNDPGLVGPGGNEPQQ